MNTNFLFNSLPNLSPEEFAFLKNLMADLSPEKQQTFMTIYRGGRKDTQTVLLLTIIGFFGVAGVHRFVLGQIGMGILYFFTGGLCLIGTIVDLVNHRNLADEYNRQTAMKALQIVNMMGDE